MPVAPMQDRSKATYRNILHAALELVENGGMAHVTVQKVADAAGVDARLVRYYFDDLEGLMVVVADSMVGRWVAALRGMLSGHSDPRDAIDHALRGLWKRLIRSDPRSRRHYLAAQEVRLGAARNRSLRPLARRAHEEVESAWLGVFQSASDRFSLAVPPPVFARMIYDTWDGVIGDYLTTGETARVKETVEGLITAFSAMITPLGAAAAPRRG